MFVFLGGGGGVFFFVVVVVVVEENNNQIKYARQETKSFLCSNEHEVAFMAMSEKNIF